MGKEFVALLGGGIERDGVVDTVIRRERYLLVTAINTGTTCIHQMLYWIVSAGFKNVVEAYDVALHVGIGVLDAVTHTRLGGQVDHDVEVIFLKKLVYQVAVGNAASYEGPRRARSLSFLFYLTQAIFLERWVVVGIHVVKANDMHKLAAIQQP